MNELIKVTGKQKIGSIDFTGIEGGFGEGKKAMLVRDIAEIHNQPQGEINRRINDNRVRFKNGVDIIDLKSVMGLSHNEYGFTQNAWNRLQNAYILSERGYSKLLKILEDDKAWEIYDELVDNYFNMREAQSKLPTNPMEVLALTFEAQKQANEKLEKVDNRVTELEENAPLSPGDYGYISRLVNQRVATIIAERHLKLTQKQRSQLYKDLNAEIKKVMRVPSRTQLRQRHYDEVLQFILTWQPSSATIAIVNQLSLEELTDIA